MSKINFLSLLTLLFFSCLTQNVTAQAYVIENYDIDISISQEGYFDVKEVISVYFNEKRRGIFRNIPSKIKINGKTVNTGLSNVEVKNHEFKIIKEGNDKRIRIGSPDVYLDGRQDYEISYRIYNAFVFDENHTEFYYNLISDWDTEVKNMRYRIALPTVLDMPFNDYQIVTGKTGAQEKNASIAKDGAIISGAIKTPVPKNENVTVILRLPPDYIAKPAPPVSVFKKDPFWYLPIGLIFLMFNYFNRSRKEFSAPTMRMEFFPPEDFCPAEVGAYIDYKVNTEDIISLLPYWANEGYIRIMSNEMEGKNHDLYFKKEKALDASAPEYQHIVFDAIFKKGDLVLLSELKNKIYAVLYSTSRHIRKSLLKKEVYDQDHYNLYHSGKFIAAALVLVCAGILLIIFSSFLLSGIATIILGIAAFVIHFLRPKRSVRGTMIHNHLLALKKFLEKGNDTKTRTLLEDEPGYFEKIYPYAIALGVDESWLKKMESYDVYAPHWYGYYHNPSMAAIPLSRFSSDFSIPEIKSAFVTAPGGSGSSGGGFSGGSSGGGFGGGGGSW